MNNLKKIREKRGLTQKEAARILDIRMDNYIIMENGGYDDFPELAEQMGESEKKLKNSKKKDIPSFSKPIFLCPLISKGGTGKTSTVVGFAGALSEKYQVLIVDCTEQVDATLSFFSDKELEGKGTVLDAMVEVDDIRKYILHTANPMIDVVPSDYRLDNIDTFLAGNIHKDQLLRACFRQLVEDNIYDFVLFDVSNHLGSFADVIWMAAETVYFYMVLRPKTYAVSQFSRTLDKINDKIVEMEKFGNKLVNIGVFMNEVDTRTASTEAVAETIKSMIGDLYIEEFIHRDENVNRSQTYKVPVTQYNRSCKAAKDFMKLSDEIVRRIEVCENGK